MWFGEGTTPEGRYNFGLRRARFDADFSCARVVVALGARGSLVDQRASSVE